MATPWSVIFSKQDVYPKPSQEQAAVSTVPMIPINLSVAPRRPLHTPCSSPIGNSAFVPWGEPMPIAELYAPLLPKPPEDPPDVLEAFATPIAQAAALQESIEEPVEIECLETEPVEERDEQCAPREELIRAVVLKTVERDALEENCDSAKKCNHEPTDALMKCGSKARGFLHFKKWWYLRKVGVSVNGKLVHGIPIFIQKNTLRVVGNTYSYIIPMCNVDYIRTSDGLSSIEREFEGDILTENPVCR